MIRFLPLAAISLFLTACVSVQVPQLPSVSGWLNSDDTSEWELQYLGALKTFVGRKTNRGLEFSGENGSFLWFDDHGIRQLARFDNDSAIYSWKSDEKLKKDDPRSRRVIFNGVSQAVVERCEPIKQSSLKISQSCYDEKNRVAHRYSQSKSVDGKIIQWEFTHPINKALVVLRRVN